MPAQTSSISFRELARAPLLILWAMFMLLMPFYVLPVGLPQPDDLLITLFAPMVLSSWNGKLPKSTRGAFRWLFWFTAWVVAVNVVWLLIIADLSNWGMDLRYPLFYIFNGLVFLVALVLHQRHGELFLRVTMQCLFASVIFQTAISFVMRGGSLRGTLFFDNPNQLGYYALCVACAIAISQRRMGIGLLKASVGLTCCGYLALISASRSAVGGVVILFVLTMLSNPRLIVIGVLLAAALFVSNGPIARAVDAMEDRVNTPRGDDQYSFFEQRGYDRIFANTQYLALGAGEVDKTRFQGTTVLGHAEIHSSIGTILFSYGVIGLFMFGAFLWRVLDQTPWRSKLIMVPPLAYATAHQGLRFTMFWVMLALFTVLKPQARRPNVGRLPSPP